MASSADNPGRIAQRVFTADFSQAATDPVWDQFVAEEPSGHHVQATAWARIKESNGWGVVRFTVASGSQILGGGQILTRSAPGLGRIGYLDQGPLISPGIPGLAEFVVEALQEAVSRFHIRLLLVQPPHGAFQLVDLMDESGFGPNHVKMGLGATVRVDLDRPEDEILAAMKSKTRYNVRKSLRSDLTVRVGEPADLAEFHGLLEATSRRQGFVPTSLSSLTQMQRHLGPIGSFEVLLAEHDRQVVAGIITIPFGNRMVFKRGAWSGQHGELHPNERLHWEAMLRARERGIRCYDFDGIEPAVARLVLDGEAIPTGAVESVTRFKLGFGGTIELLPASRSFVANRPLRWAYDTFYPRFSRSAVLKNAVARLRQGK